MTSSEEGRQLRETAIAAKASRAVAFDSRDNPTVQQMHAKTLSAKTSDRRFVYGSNLRDWMTGTNFYFWRSDLNKGGPRCAPNYIGLHRSNWVEHLTGRKSESVLADLTTAILIRFSKGKSSEAFSHDKLADSTFMRIDSEDMASVLLHFECDAHGHFYRDQTIPGHKNDAELEVSVSVLFMGWRQEDQDQLWIGKYDARHPVIVEDPVLLSRNARPHLFLPGSHHESCADAYVLGMSDKHRWIRDGGTLHVKQDMLPRFQMATVRPLLSRPYFAATLRGNMGTGAPRSCTR